MEGPPTAQGDRSERYSCRFAARKRRWHNGCRAHSLLKTHRRGEIFGKRGGGWVPARPLETWEGVGLECIYIHEIVGGIIYSQVNNSAGKHGRESRFGAPQPRRAVAGARPAPQQALPGPLQREVDSHRSLAPPDRGAEPANSRRPCPKPRYFIIKFKTP